MYICIYIYVCIYVYIYIYILYISATVPSGHQGIVSNERTSCQLPVADYQLPVADYQLLLRQPLVASPGEIADFLNSFKGPHGASPRINRNPAYGLHENNPLIFRFFFRTPFFHVFVPKQSRKRFQKVSKIVEIHEKTPSGSSFQFIPPKRIPKV